MKGMELAKAYYEKYGAGMIESVCGKADAEKIAELRRTKAPAVLVEVAYHDNEEDAEWIINNIDQIAENLALSTADILGVPFVEP